MNTVDVWMSRLEVRLETHLESFEYNSGDSILRNKGGNVEDFYEYTSCGLERVD